MLAPTARSSMAVVVKYASWCHQISRPHTAPPCKALQLEASFARESGVPPCAHAKNVIGVHTQPDMPQIATYCACSHEQRAPSRPLPLLFHATTHFWRITLRGSQVLKCRVPLLCPTTHTHKPSSAQCHVCAGRQTLKKPAELTIDMASTSLAAYAAYSNAPWRQSGDAVTPNEAVLHAAAALSCN